jgi:hypothetical protein
MVHQTDVEGVVCDETFGVILSVVGNHLLSRCWRCGLSADHNTGQNDHTLVSRVAAARPPWISMLPSPRSLPGDNHSVWTLPKVAITAVIVTKATSTSGGVGSRYWKNNGLSLSHHSPLLVCI